MNVFGKKNPRKYINIVKIYVNTDTEMMFKHLQKNTNTGKRISNNWQKQKAQLQKTD